MSKDNEVEDREIGVLGCIGCPFFIRPAYEDVDCSVWEGPSDFYPDPIDYPEDCPLRRQVITVRKKEKPE